MLLTHVRFAGTPDAGRSAPPQCRTRTRPFVAPASNLAPAAAVARESLPGLVLAGAGMDPSAYRAVPLARRIPACLRAVRADSEDTARRRLATGREDRRAALSALLIGVSDFFRDAAVFDALERLVMPALLARPGVLRVASIGCSSGAELYSVAMLLAEAGLLDRSFLLGVDCREDAIAEATAGEFSADALANVPPARQSAFFEPSGRGRRAIGALRQRIAWQVLDATHGLPDGLWDLVLCRNLTIYLHPRAAQDLLAGIAARLTRGGFLVVGKAERAPAGMRLTSVGRCLYRNDA